jgi:adhesin transport system membrane fusion protein
MQREKGMLSDEQSERDKVAHLENYHRGRFGVFLWGTLLVMLAFAAWAMTFRLDEVARATGEVIASSRVQVIQAVDGGVIASIEVREGDRVKPGQVLARLDPTRVGATLGEVQARLAALQAKTLRLRSEVTGAGSVDFSAMPKDIGSEFVKVERALFEQRRIGLQEELRTLRVAVDLAKQQLALVQDLQRSGDVSLTELLRVQRELNDADSRYINRKNKFLEDARIELAKAEDERAQNEQVQTRRQQERNDSVFTAAVSGVVKNIKVTTVGGVLRAGDEIMQIVPVDDDLVIEAKVSPADIARVQKGLDATVRFDPFDYTIFGGVAGKVAYVSADTLKEQTGKGTEVYYRVHVTPASLPVTSTTGRQLEILPGMTAQVDIRTGDRTLMSYLLKPIRKTLSESFGEK